MTIVVLDGFTLNPGDLSWDELKALGPCEIHDRTPPEEITQRIADREIVLTNKTVLDKAIIESLPRLKYIGVTATGTDIVDLDAARKRGVPVTNVPAYGTASVAQTTMALLLELVQGVGHHSRTVRQGRWSQSPDFCYWDQPLIELSGLTMGIVGFGRIGRAVAELAHAFGMSVVVFAPSPKPAAVFARYVDLQTVFRQSDVVSLHCPLSPQTRELVNRERLSWMKSSAFLINTSRGQLIDEAALAEALNLGGIAGAALDVLAQEPPPSTNPLLQAKNCIITPHFAWATRASRQRLMQIAVENARAFLNGRPQNVVN
jgi:glycerate dehydrogenase